MAGIRDVAVLADVSVASVSRYLNNPSIVKIETREKIQAAIEELQYIPNAHAKVIFTNESMNIAVIIPSSEDPFFSEIVMDIETKATQLGYNTFLCNTMYDREIEKQQIKMLQENRTDGIIVVESQNVDLYEQVKIPLVSIGTRVKQDSPLIVADDYSGGKIACDYLIKVGAKSIAYVKNRNSSVYIQDQEDGFYSSVPLDIKIVEIYLDSVFEPIKSEDPLQGIEKFDAAFVSSDVYAFRVLQYLHHHKAKKRSNTIVLGYGDIAFGKLSVPTLSTIAMDKTEFSSYAVGIVIDLIHGKHNIKDKKVEVKLVERQSTLYEMKFGE